MFNYTFEPNEDIKILTSFDMEQVKKEVILSGDHSCHLLTYPNGLKIKMNLYPDKVIINSNKELVDNGDGTMDILI